MASAETKGSPPPNTVEQLGYKEFLASLSLANLCFLNVWIELGSTEHDYYRKLPPSANMIKATAALVVLVGITMWGFIAAARRTHVVWTKVLAYVPICFALVLALNVCKTSITTPAGQLPEFSNWIAVAILFGLACLTFWLAWQKERWLTRTLTAGLLILFPLFPILVGQSIWIHFNRSARGSFADRTSQPSQASRRTRLVWMIFDEWDYRLTFRARPKGLVLPAIDRLSRESFNATHAVGGGYGTANAMPSMLVGRRVVDSQTSGPAELLLRFEGAGDFVGWSSQPSLFSKIRDAGWTTSVVGWYHPYCRVLGTQLDYCGWQPGASIYDRDEYARNPTFLEAGNAILDRQVSKIPLVNRFDIVRRDLNKRHLQSLEYTQIRNAAFATLGTTDFVMVHWPVPHPYGIYDRSRGALRSDTRQTYLDNLALVDKIISDFRSLLEERKQWDNTTLVLTSDHSLRVHEWNQPRLWSAEEAAATGNTRSAHVPFLIKLSGQTRPVTYEKPFSILLTHDLLVAMTRGELLTVDALAPWFDANRTRFAVRAEN